MIRLIFNFIFVYPVLGYSRNLTCALNLIYAFLFLFVSFLISFPWPSIISIVYGDPSNCRCFLPEDKYSDSFYREKLILMGTITVNTDLVEGKLMGNGTSQPSLFWIYQNFFPMYINMTWNMMCEICLRTFFLMIYSFIFQKSRKKKRFLIRIFIFAFFTKFFFLTFEIW